MDLASSHRLDALRVGILVGLGLSGCGPGTAATATESGGASTADATGTSTTARPTTGGASSGTGETATGATGSTTTTDPTTGAGGSTTTDPGTTTGTTTGATATSGGASTDATTGFAGSCRPVDCEEPEELMQLFAPDVASGFVRCASGLVHRVAAVACAVPMPPGDCAQADAACKTDADCVDAPFGACRASGDCGPIDPDCGCAFGCETDADCLEGQVCLCGIAGLNDLPRCISAGCVTDADCGDNSCGPETDATGAEVWSLRCHFAGDECCSDADCSARQHCEENADHWYCQGLSDCGRPLVVDGRAALAPAAARRDWHGAATRVELPEPALRGRVAAHWTRAARAEHASVGSFARFILQLLALGAPPALVLAAQQALADEVAHAQVCFALASAYAGAEVGPGPLPAACAPLAVDSEAAVLAAIDEACVGETLSALEVAEAAGRAACPRLRALLLQIADDEARHAVLGWAFVRWALADADDGLRHRAGERFAAALARGAAEPLAIARTDDATEVLRRHGVVDVELRAQVVRRGLAGVVGPCAAALLAA